MIPIKVLESYFELAMLEEQRCNTSCHEFSYERLQNKAGKLVRVRLLVEEKLVKCVNLDFSVWCFDDHFLAFELSGLRLR